MAEIHIEKKSRPIWPWILGILLVVGLVWVVMELTDKDKQEMAYGPGATSRVEEPVATDGSRMEQEEQMGQQPESPEGEVGAFVSMVNDQEAMEDIGVDHEKTGEGLLKLTSALKEVSAEDESYEPELDELEQKAEDIKADSMSLQQPNQVSEVMTQAADVMGKIQESQFPEVNKEVDRVEDAAKAIQPEEQLKNQKQEVQIFFEESASALEEMEGQKSGQDVSM